MRLRTIACIIMLLLKDSEVTGDKTFDVYMRRCGNGVVTNMEGSWATVAGFCTDGFWTWHGIGKQWRVFKL